jgi:hypothetical protein
VSALDNLPPPNPLDNLAPPPAASSKPEYYTITGAGQTGPTSYPVGRELADFAANTRMGLGKLYTNLVLGGQQAITQAIPPVEGATGAEASGVDPNAIRDYFTGQTSAEKRLRDQPLSATMGGKAGEVIGAVPLAFLPGVNTYAGAGALGGLLGGLQPTVGNESRGVNTALGAALGMASQYVGNKVGSWVQRRASEPFMGWNPGTASEAAAESVGSSAPRLNQDALREAHERFTDIFGRARRPDVPIQVGDATLDALETTGKNLNSSSRAAFYANDQVKDLTAHLGSNPSAEQLGQISSQIGNEAASQLSIKAGDRALGRALFKLQDHVDDLVGGSIADPALRAAYDAARPQYRNFLMLRGRPSVLNSATGEVNATALGKYLQRADPVGYAEGVNTSPLYEAGRWGQATKEGAGAPRFSIENLGIPWAAYHAANNPLARALGGVASRAAVPVGPYLGRAGQVAAIPAREPLARALSVFGNPQQQ